MFERNKRQYNETTPHYVYEEYGMKKNMLGRRSYFEIHECEAPKHLAGTLCWYQVCVDYVPEHVVEHFESI
jgi:hypothetical protein